MIALRMRFNPPTIHVNAKWSIKAHGRKQRFYSHNNQTDSMNEDTMIHAAIKYCKDQLPLLDLTVFEMQFSELDDITTVVTFAPKA